VAKAKDKTLEREAPAREVYLASRSRTRARLLTNAGIAFTAEPAAVDEPEVKSAMWAEGANTEAAAAALAKLKARKVSGRHPEAFVIGSDQILECGGVWFDKPDDLEQARAQLKTLRGRTHRLVSDTFVFLDGSPMWSHGAVAELVMRDFSDAFLEDYLEVMGRNVLNVVGGYEIEGLGAQLFAKVTGDFFAILGLPLLPLLDFLRVNGVLPE